VRAAAGARGPVPLRTARQSSPRVEYELTALGRTLLEPIGVFGAWAFEYGDEVMAAQDAYARDGQTREV